MAHNFNEGEDGSVTGEELRSGECDDGGTRVWGLLRVVVKALQRDVVVDGWLGLQGTRSAWKTIEVGRERREEGMVVVVGAEGKVVEGGEEEMETEL